VRNYRFLHPLFGAKSKIALPLKLLSKRDHRFLFLVILVTIFLALLDLFGVLLIGVIGSLSITGISTGQTGNRVGIVLRVFGLNNTDFELQALIIGFIAAVSLISKTLLSLVLVKKTMFFMSRRAAALSANLLKRYFTVPVSQLNMRSIHTSIYALTDGVSTIMVGVIGIAIALISDIALLLILGAGLFIVDPITAFGSLFIFGSLAYILYHSMHEKMRKLGEERSLLRIESAHRISEAISSYRELLVRHRRGYYAKQIGDLRYKLADGSASMLFMSSFSKYILEVTLVLSAVLLAYYQFSTTTAVRAIATITVFIAASTRIIPAILRLQQGILGMKASLAESKPTLLLIDELSELNAVDFEETPLLRSHADFIPEISVSNVSFSYDGEREVLKNVDFDASPGEFVAIVGGSGEGKTTLVDVILGALQCTEGEVLISGSSPEETFAKWPGAVSYVPQDCTVVDGTIRENLTLGYQTQEINDEYCWEGLKLASLDKFVRSLPDELESNVGDRGTRLSGGQRQRLGIARALITRPKLLILDEATSSLDSLTESEISESLKGLKGKITQIVIAHRLSTIVNADKIYLVEKGTVKLIKSFMEFKRLYPEFFEQANSRDLG
jgi:ABC-type multidrug transport system fused ATPase/permease subunit